MRNHAASGSRTRACDPVTGLVQLTVCMVPPSSTRRAAGIATAAAAMQPAAETVSDQLRLRASSAEHPAAAARIPMAASIAVIAAPTAPPRKEAARAR